MYKFDFDLDELIGSSLTELCDPEKDEDTIKFKQTLNNFSAQLKTVESKIKFYSIIIKISKKKLIK
jgi:hypothetical protein